MDFDNEEIVSRVLLVIAEVQCAELIPNVRALIENSSSLRLQAGGLLALSDLGDREGIDHIARTHPSTKIRNAAKSLLSRIDAQESLPADNE